jgi:tetratricopeptide (TPR) repeat protein
MDDRDLIKGTAAWLARTPVSEITPELSVTDALNEVPEFLSLLAAGTLPAARFQPDDHAILALRVACKVLAEPDAGRLEKPLEAVQSLYDFIHGLAWPQPDFGERAELLADCAFAGWRISRKLEKPREEAQWLEKFRTAVASESPLRFEVERVPASSISERQEPLSFEDTELLLAVCEMLSSRVEKTPTATRDGAILLYEFLSEQKRSSGLVGEMDYYMGELALIAGASNRLLFHREEARRWLDRAETSFSCSANASAHVARVAYQRLALAIEERRLNEVLELAPFLVERFELMGLAEGALKCRFLEGGALREIGEIDRSVTVFLDIFRRAEDQGNVRLLAQASNNLAQVYRVRGDLDEAMVYARKTLPLLQQLENQVGLAKLRWCVGNILHEQGKLNESLGAYREALEGSRAIGMRADMVALHLVLADTLLDLGQDREAEEEIRIALPIIDEEGMVPEGFAALSLLRDALRFRQIDRKALRELHGYFGDSQA